MNWMMLAAGAFVWFGAVGAEAARGSPRGVVEFSDETFDPSLYTTIFLNPPLPGQLVGQEPNGGNSGTTPDPYRIVTTVTNVLTLTVHLPNAFVVDPSVTPIDSVDFSMDRRAIGASGQGMFYRFVLVQAGTVHNIGGAFTGTGPPAFQWATYDALGLTADDLPNADFTASGGPIQFGFQTGDNGGVANTAGFDNLRVTVRLASCPEDINGDGSVDFEDLNLLLGNFNMSAAGLAGDVDDDGDVDFADLNRLVGLFNTEC